MSLEKLNENIRLQLIKARNSAGLSQSDVAAKSEIFGVGRMLDQNTVVRIEKQPLAMDFIKLVGYLSAIGMSINDFYELLNKYAYEDDRNAIKIRLRDDFTKKQSTLILETLMKVKALIYNLPERSQEFLRVNAFSQIESYLAKTKPIIGFFGASNSGKSTLINVVIGQSLLATSIYPTTRIITLLMHVSDKPSHIVGSVAVFKKGFHPLMVFDETLVKQYLIAQGDKSILLKRDTPVIESENYIAIVFAEADILNHVWLLDTAGDLENSIDTEMALSSAELVDGAVFMSDMHDFLKPNEWGLMANVIRLKPPLTSETPTNHLLLIQSQCDSDVDIETVKKVGESAINRTQKQFDTVVFSSWGENPPTSKQLFTRMQPFGRENNVLRTQTLSTIQELAKYLISHKENELVATIKREIEVLNSNLLLSLNSLQEMKTHSDDRLNKIENLKTKFNQASEVTIGNFHKLLDKCDSSKKADIKAMKVYFDDTTSQIGLTKIIEEIYLNHKEAQAEIGNYIGQLLIIKMEDIFKSSGERISKEVSYFLDEWDTSMNNPRHYSYSIFKSGFYGLSNIGAFAFCPFLKESSPLFTKEISESDVAEGITENMMIGAKALGSPIANSITLATTIGYITYRFVGGSWQSNLAKKTANVVRNGDVWGKIEPLIVDFWDSTERAISHGLNSLFVSTKDRIDSEKYKGSHNLREPSQIDGDILTIEQAIKLLSELDKYKV